MPKLYGPASGNMPGMANMPENVPPAITSRSPSAHPRIPVRKGVSPRSSKRFTSASMADALKRRLGSKRSA